MSNLGAGIVATGIVCFAITIALRGAEEPTTWERRPEKPAVQAAADPGAEDRILIEVGIRDYCRSRFPRDYGNVERRKCEKDQLQAFAHFGKLVYSGPVPGVPAEAVEVYRGLCLMRHQGDFESAIYCVEEAFAAHRRSAR
ncbi:hypothetical protein [Thioalkalivibrio sp.]|uniref:hypothetical protein n=1 Tax=Thioalkalivibrio sp. TaxID=2093813 RepID=UPI003569902E